MDKTRKAAILIASLDARTADALLEGLPPHEADAVRRLAVELDWLDPAEQEAVIGEFLGRPLVVAPSVGLDSGWRRSRPPEGGTTNFSGVELELTQQSPDDGPRFRFLQDAECQRLTPFLQGEHPQTIAVVLSHLAPRRALEVLSGLASSLQADVVRRLVDLDEMDPEVLRDVERGLQSRISQHVRIERRRAAGLSAVVQILAAADRNLERQLLSNLTRYVPQLARQLPRRPWNLNFEDLTQFDDATLAALLRAADPEVTTLALAGSSPDLVERVLRQLPIHEARGLRQAWQNLGPTPLSDVEGAQQELVRLAERLDVEGRIDLPHALRASVA